MVTPSRGQHPRLQPYVLHLHQGGELLADLVRRHLLESQAVAVEPERPLEVGDADAEVGDRERHDSSTVGTDVVPALPAVPVRLTMWATPVDSSTSTRAPTETASGRCAWTNAATDR